MKPTSLFHLRKIVNAMERGQHTVRCHTFRCLFPQTVGAHSGMVANLCWAITGGSASANLLMAALTHDLPECSTGDVPANVKRVSPAIREALDGMESVWYKQAAIPDFPTLITNQEKLTLKIADSLELMMHCVREREMGNNSEALRHCMTNISRYLEEYLREQANDQMYMYFEAAEALTNEVKATWIEAGGTWSTNPRDIA